MKNEYTDIMKAANEELSVASEKPLTIEEYIEELIENPNIARNAHQYLLDAIEYYGTVTVYENGEEKERYRFFDDPENNGENAILGNTDELSRFVNDLRVIVNRDERMQKIFLINGPTATGKSELKRCIINGLNAYSKTEEGKRYTCEWNISSLTGSSGLTYGESNRLKDVDETAWFRSPVQVTPLAVLPPKTRKLLSKNIRADGLPKDINLDPFSQEAYNTLKKHYERNDSMDNLFESITSEKHLRIQRYTLDETQGIGVLMAEDEGSVKERLIGTWMPSLFKVLDSRGRKNPQAFSYDGVLAQGNGGVTVVEDASKHADILVHLLNIPDESSIKIDMKIGYDVDTVPIFISNPDLLKSQLSDNINNQTIDMTEIQDYDALKSIKRRILQYQINYITSIQDEFKLIQKELGVNTDNITDDINAKINIYNKEFAPHTLEAVATYNVISRLEKRDKVSLIEKAKLYNKGYINTSDGRITFEDVELENKEVDGKFGIPVTYTRDTIQNLIYSEEEPKVYLPNEILEYVADGLEDALVIHHVEKQEFKKRVEHVKEYILSKQVDDVIEAILYEKKATESAKREYIDNLFDWDEDNEYNEHLMKDFEINHLGMKEEDYDKEYPKENVLEFRKDKILKPLQVNLWEKKNDGYNVEDIREHESQIMDDLLGSYDWEDVFRQYPKLNPVNWDNPANNTPTEEVKSTCIHNMVTHLDYSERAAKKTCEKVFQENNETINQIKNQLVN